MNIQKNVSLKPYNTFGIDANAAYFSSFSTVEELREILSDKKLPSKKLILGGGSNVLILNDLQAVVLKNELKGIELLFEDDRHYYVKAAAGENWNRVVQYCIHHNFAGIENLSLIPGNVGAAPMQNIGAYGVELKEVFSQLEALEIKTGKTITFSNNDCAFGYRDSIFKQQAKDQFVILNITLRLNKEANFNTTYGAIASELEKMGVSTPTIQTVSEAVINIRKSKLPDPAVIGNAGSFFKNPVVYTSIFQALKSKFPELPGYEAKEGFTKIPAAFLIEKCGWKGYRAGDAGCHTKQPLVLVNYGKASGKEIYELAEKIKKSVLEKFGILLEREVNVF